MTTTTVRVLRVDKPGNSLATWLALHHPDIFLAAFQKSRAAKVKKSIQGLGLLAMGRLADDDGLTTTFDVSDSSDPIDFSAIDTDPDLASVTLDDSALGMPSNMIGDTSDVSQSIGDTPTSTGTTVGSAVSSAGSSVLGALGSVGNFLTSSAGLTSLTNLAKAYYGAQAASSTAQTQQAVLQAQIARAATNQTAAPITYARNAQGQLVPVYATQTANGTVYQPLSSQGIAALTPSSVSVFLNQYGVWIALGGAVILAVSLTRRKGDT